MRGLGKIVSRLNAARRTMEAANANDEGRLQALTGFGSNPGDLDARVYLPSGQPTGLVAVLHGCTQSAAVYDKGSGWSKLAERHGFAVLFPQQRRTNNSNLCFNWYLPSDARRGRGEAASISQMVQHLAAKYRLDRSHVFITGLSAGGAMTSVDAGVLPRAVRRRSDHCGTALRQRQHAPRSARAMRGQGFPSQRRLQRWSSSANSHPAPPVVSVWHGTNDNIVDPSNATAIVDQWRDVHQVGRWRRASRCAGRSSPGDVVRPARSSGHRALRHPWHGPRHADRHARQ